MKVGDIRTKEGEIDNEEQTFDQRKELREEAKSEYDEDLEDHVDAIKALNEAIDILSKYFKSKGASLVQSRGKFQSPEGTKAMEMMSTVRTEFEDGQAQLTKTENEELAAQLTKTENEE